MTDEKKKMTAQGSSVGADDGQSISQITENSIPTSRQKSNDEIVNSQDSLEEMYRKIQRMTDPRYLHTLTMTEPVSYTHLDVYKRQVYILPEGIMNRICGRDLRAGFLLP